jgi:hypothetical protein
VKKYNEKSPEYSGGTRRDFIKSPAGLAAGSLLLPPVLASLASEAKAQANGNAVTIAPVFYPLDHFKPEIDLTGKLAVITGASRGNGRAIAETLRALGVDVIGTSRNPAGVPNPPAYPLLALDIADQASVLAFVGRSWPIRYFSSTVTSTFWGTMQAAS